MNALSRPGTVDGCDQAPGDLSLDQAHAIMQQHRHATPGCTPRQAALRLLVQAGRYRLDGRGPA